MTTDLRPIDHIFTGSMAIGAVTLIALILTGNASNDLVAAGSGGMIAVGMLFNVWRGHI